MSGRGTSQAIRMSAWAIGVVIFAAATLTACVPVQKCNGYAALCDRAYDAVSYPTTHNAMSNIAEGWKGPLQSYGLTRQLNEGVRGLMLDTHYNAGSSTTAPNDVALLCHGPCVYGWERLSDGLGKIKTFLDSHPDEVVTIIFETYVSPADTKAAFDLSGASSLVATHTPGAAWPTLRQMIASNQRLVVMTDSGGGTYPWYLPTWSEAFENPYAATSTATMSCNVNRGNGNNRLFILNNFITNPLGNRQFATAANAMPDFLTRAQNCQTARSHLPNFVTVDFYEIGGVMSVVKTLNGV
jgi:hypothetical protein